MAIISKTAIKATFETGDVPTEAEYINLIDTLLVHPLEVVFGSSSTTYVISSGFMLTRLVLFTDLPIIGVKVGSTFGGSEYYTGNVPDPTVPLVVDIGAYAHTSPITIYLEGSATMSYKAFLQ